MRVVNALVVNNEEVISKFGVGQYFSAIHVVCSFSIWVALIRCSMGECYYFLVMSILSVILLFFNFRSKPLVERIIWVVVSLLFISGLNYLGFCWREFRFLSDQEKIDKAIFSYIQGWNGSVEHINKNQTGMMKFMPVMKISSVDEFKKIYPGCCRLYKRYNSFSGKTSETMAMDNDSSGMGQQVSLFSKLTGCTFGYVEIEWRVPHLKDGVITSGVPAANGARVSNCGEISRPINYMR